MTIYTTTATGLPSTAEIDAAFAAVQGMSVVDAFGCVDELKTAQMWEAASQAWRMRDLHFGDGRGMILETRAKAAAWYRKHADRLEAMNEPV